MDCLRAETPSTGGQYVWHRHAGIAPDSGYCAHRSRPEKAAGASCNQQPFSHLRQLKTYNLP